MDNGDVVRSTTVNRAHNHRIARIRKLEAGAKTDRRGALRKVERSEVRSQYTLVERRRNIMSKIIVGIHGLANKPKKQRLEHFWKDSIREGLKKNCEWEGSFEFELVYWADLLYKNQLHEDSDFDFDNLYNDQPYTPGPDKLPRYKDRWSDEVRAKASAMIGSGIDWVKQHVGMDAAAEWILENKLKDLAFYYDEDRKILDRSEPQEQVCARKVLRDELKTLLHNHSGKQIMLIAHSMGSIIAYDVLRDMEREREKVEIEHFVTIGSPLGLPHVKAKILKERRVVRTPTVVTGTWANYADRRDPVAIDTHLRDDFEPNRRRIMVKDDLIDNTYESPSKKPNYHKSYGYLRAPELSDHIRKFL